MFGVNYCVKKEDYCQFPTGHVKEEHKHLLNGTVTDNPQEDF